MALLFSKAPHKDNPTLEDVNKHGLEEIEVIRLVENQHKRGPATELTGFKEASRELVSSRE